LCRVWAKELSTLKPQLDAHNISLVAVGVEEFGVDEFVAGKFFAGDVYIDQDYGTYKGLGLGRVSMLQLPKQMLSSTFRNANAKANSQGIDGNMKGDGLQLGGTYVIEKGGTVLYGVKQQGFGDHPPLSDLINALGMNTKVETQEVEDESCCQEK